MYATSLNGLTPLVKEPRRVTEHTKTAVDLVFVDNLHRIGSHGEQEFLAADHSVVFAVKKSCCLQGLCGNLRNEVIQALQQRTISQ